MGKILFITYIRPEMLSLYGALKHHIMDYFLSITRLTLCAENTLLIKLLVPQKHRDSGDKLPSAPTLAASAVVGLSLRVARLTRGFQKNQWRKDSIRKVWTQGISWRSNPKDPAALHMRSGAFQTDLWSWTRAGGFRGGICREPFVLVPAAVTKHHTLGGL